MIRSLNSTVLSLFLLFQIGLLLPASGSSKSGGAQGAQEVFQEKRDLIFQIKIALSEKSPKASYGSGFAVGKDGLIATNFHVIAEAIHEPELQIFAVTLKDGTTRPAKILNFDVVHDLALLKVEQEFQQIVDLRSTPLKNGEKVFSVGLPKDLNMLIVEGNFNDGKKGSVFERYVLSTPLNGGMSGGPTFDEHGAVVGVNVAYLRNSNSISFAVPGYFLRRLLDSKERLPVPLGSPEGRQLAAASPYKEKIEKQLLDLQESQISNLVSKKAEAFEFGPWSFSANTDGLNCWRNESKREKVGAVVEDQHCFLPFDATLYDGWETGDYGFRAFRIRSRDEGKTLAWSAKNNLVDPGDRGSLTAIGENREQHFTGQDCKNLPIKNSAGIDLFVSFCIAGYRDYPKLHNYFIQAVTRQPAQVGRANEPFVVQGTFRGLTAENIKRITKHLLDQIKSTGGSRK